MPLTKFIEIGFFRTGLYGNSIVVFLFLELFNNRHEKRASHFVEKECP